MAVFTTVSREQCESLLSEFSLGKLVQLTPIESGIENTNYFLDTDQGRWVLTIFELLKTEQLSFYLELCEHLALKGCRVACPQRGRDGKLIHFVSQKPCSIANRLAGENVRNMGVPECRSMGALLAQMHLAAANFPLKQPNLRGLAWWEWAAPQIRPHVPAAISSAYDEEIAHQKALQESADYQALTVVACHCDLFRDNALIDKAGTPQAHVAGVFDFYFAGCSPCLFDLAVCMNDWCTDMATGKFVPEKAQAFIEAYNQVRPLSDLEHRLWRELLRAAALRFWMSRLFDFYLPRSAALLKPHDPTEFERILADRKTCTLPWPQPSTL